MTPRTTKLDWYQLDDGGWARYRNEEHFAARCWRLPANRPDGKELWRWGCGAYSSACWEFEGAATSALEAMVDCDEASKLHGDSFIQVSAAPVVDPRPEGQLWTQEEQLLLMARACLDLEEKLDAARALAERRKKALEPFLDSIIKSDLAFARYNNCKCGMVAAPIEIDEAKAAYDATE